ncbi:ABC transporter ATP-binding protein [Muribaculum sp.]|uniref:ABC transporter ATP-binding protein n=1 Tax=Muribaculum sp. TaxID=1918611 RepID=UPI0023D235C5|nr:ATP-binding cassette domain-containing protein [Muribaculum sp.]MDE5705448.1 ATP-binding cassette domain-containing protein [Muribaculum sp.]
MNNLIEASGVVKRYDGHTALDGVDLSIPEGTIYGLLGPNGAGKTTLIRIINQIITPDSGTVLLNGKPLHPDDVMRVGYLPEERGLYKKMKVIDHIVYLGRLKGMTSRDARAEAEKWLRRMNLVEWAGKKIEALSKGMAQKVQFIGTVVHRPPLMIFDEPFSGFDPVNAEQLKQEILELNRGGATILFSTHNMSSVEEVCDSISLINHSKVVLQGNVADVRQRHKKHLFKVRVAEPVIAPNPSLFQIDSIEPDIMGGSQIILRLAPDVAMRTVIDFLNPIYTILGFEEIFPTMNEIFIETVTGNE